MVRSNLKVVRRYEVNSDWNEIARQIENGNNGFLNVGDEIKCTLKDGKDVTIVVLHLDAYKEGVLFGFKDIHFRKPWNRQHTNRGWWRDCYLNEWCNSEFINLLPDELVRVITPRTIIQKYNGTSSESTGKIWLPSKTEMDGDGEYTSDYNDIHLDYFKDKRNRVKFMNGEPYYHALRSPNVSSTTYFWAVGGNGGCGGNYGYAGYSDGVCPCFAIFRQDGQRIVPSEEEEDLLF